MLAEFGGFFIFVYMVFYLSTYKVLEKLADRDFNKLVDDPEFKRKLDLKQFLKH